MQTTHHISASSSSGGTNSWSSACRASSSAAAFAPRRRLSIPCSSNPSTSSCVHTNHNVIYSIEIACTYDV